MNIGSRYKKRDIHMNILQKAVTRMNIGSNIKISLSRDIRVPRI